MFSVVESKGILRTCTEEFMLSSQYKPHDPLSAEFIRTFRHQNFLGKYYLDRYDALHQKKGSVDVRLLMPRNGCGQDVPDQVALYGFRDLTPNLFFLSPWEFCQWYKPHRLRAPSKNYPPWTKFTATGRARLKEEGSQNISWRPGVDFVVNEELVAQTPYLFPYPCWQTFFEQRNDAYTQFRHTWLLIRRQRPVVPSPERCPLPGKRMSKDTRSKILSVYLRPWTLVRKVATETVPYLPHLSRNRSASMQQTISDTSSALPQESEQRQVSNIRRCWKEYL